MKRKEYISPTLRVRTIKIHHQLLQGSRTESLDNTNSAQTDYDNGTDDMGGGSIDAKRSGFHWGPIDQGEN